MTIFPDGVPDLPHVPGLNLFRLPALKLPLNLSCVSPVLSEKIPGDNQMIAVIGDMVFLQDLQLPETFLVNSHH